MISRYRPYAMLAICLFFLLYKYLLMLFPAVMTSHLMRCYRLSGVGLGNLAASFSYGAVVFQLLAGPIEDRYGIVIPGVGAIAIATIGVAVFSVTSNVEAALLARLLMGAGASFATVSYLRCSALWFSRGNSGLVGGMLTIGVMCGAFLAGAPLAWAVEHQGPSNALSSIAAFGLLLLVITFLYLREPAKTEYRPLSDLKKQLKLLVCQPANGLLALYSGLAFAPLAVFGGLWGTPFLQTVDHLSKPAAASLLSLSYIGFGFGGPVFGVLADKRETPYGSMLMGLVCTAVCLFAVVYWPNNLVLVGIAMLGFGLGTGSFMLGFNLARHINSLALAGSIVSFINSGDTVLSAITEPLLGRLLDWHWRGAMLNGARVFDIVDYQKAFSVLFFYLLVAFGCVCFLKRYLSVKNKVSQFDRQVTAH